MQGGEKDRAQGYQGTRAAAASSRHRGRRDGKGGWGGWYFHPPPSSPGAWRRPGPPTPPDHPGWAWPGQTRPPHTSRASGAVPRTTRPNRLRWRRSRRKAHTSLKLVASSLPRLPPLRLPAPEPGRPMPAPAPPAWLHKVAEKPPPARACSEGPEEFLGSAGSAAPAMCPTSRARRTAGRVAARRTHSLSPLQPAPPSTHLSPGPTESGRGSLGPGFPAFRSPFGPRSLSPISEGQSVRRLSPAAPATCPKFRCPARELRLPPPPGLLRLRATGKARPALPFTLPSAPPPLPMSSPRPPPPLSPSPAPGARAPTVNPHPLPAAPGRGQHTPPAVPPRPAPPLEGLPRRPRGNVVPPVGSARHAGICSPTLRALAWVRGTWHLTWNLCRTWFLPLLQVFFSSQSVMPRTPAPYVHPVASLTPRRGLQEAVLPGV